MDFFEVVEKRYSVRGYENRAVEDYKLNQILEAGRLAPTGVNRQAFKIFVIDVEKNKKILSEINQNQWFLEAPIILAVVVDTSEAWVRPADNRSISDIDGAIVMDHMILAATALNLGTCWIAAFDNKKAEKFFDLNDSEEIVALCTLGYPSSDKKAKNSYLRKDLEDLVIYK